MSLAQLSDKIGVSPRVLLLAEKGSTPRPENGSRIALYFGKTFTELWPEDDDLAVAA